MNKIQATELGSEIEKRRNKKIPLVENVLNKIREIEWRDENQEIYFIDIIDESIEELWEKPKNELAINYLNLLETHHKYEGDIEKFKRNAKQVQERVENLAELVAKRKPKLPTEQQLELVDKLYEFSSDGDKFRKEDEIEQLRVILETERFKISTDDSTANPAYVAHLEAQITDLQSQLSF